MPKRAALLILLATLNVAAAPAAAPAAVPAAAPLIAERDIAVLNAVMKTQCALRYPRRAVISNLAAGDAGAQLPSEWRGADYYDQALKARGSASASWPLMEFCPQARIVTHESIQKVFAADKRVPPGWENFNKVFDGATVLMSFSRPVFSPDGTHAIIRQNSTCGPLCGMGTISELEKRPGGWRVVRTTGTWIS